MDFSNYDIDNKLYNPSRKNQLFLLKDETEGNKIITNFIGLAPKQYSFQYLDKNKQIVDKKCHKGLSKSAIKHQLQYKDYLISLQKFKNFTKSSCDIKSKDHQLYTLYNRKKIVNCFYDKRYVLNCNVCTVPYGSVYIKKNNDYCIKCNKK